MKALFAGILVSGLGGTISLGVVGFSAVTHFWYLWLYIGGIAITGIVGATIIGDHSEESAESKKWPSEERRDAILNELREVKERREKQLTR